MSDLYPARRTSLVPSKVDSAARQIERRAAIARRLDQVRIERVARATEYGLVAAAHLSSVASSLGAMAPEAREDLRAIQAAGTVGIAGVVADARYGV